MEMFYILIVVIIIWVWIFVKTHRTDYLQCILWYTNYITIKLTKKKIWRRTEAEEKKFMPGQPLEQRVAIFLVHSGEWAVPCFLNRALWRQDSLGKVCGVLLFRWTWDSHKKYMWPDVAWKQQNWIVPFIQSDEGLEEATKTVTRTIK